jgi:hypothetical protein
MAKQHNKSFTIYDVMEANGVFSDNPANADAATYAGPQQYPRMLYHPKGEEKVTNQGEVLVTAFGPKMVNVQKELISKIVNNKAEEDEALAQGWHKHPAGSMVAGGKDAPQVTSPERKAHLQAQRAAIDAELKAADEIGKAPQAAPVAAAGKPANKLAAAATASE